MQATPPKTMWPWRFVGRMIAISMLVCAISAAAEVGDPPTNLPGNDWPNSVHQVQESEGDFVYSIKGLFGEQERWSKISNSVMRMSKFFAESDSLAVDLETGLAWIYTKRPPDAIPELVNLLARYNGFIPTWEELLVRDRKSPAVDEELYHLLAKKEFKGGYAGLAFLNIGGSDQNSMIFRYYDNPHSLPLVAVYELVVSIAASGECELAFGLVDSLSNENMYSQAIDKGPRQIEISLGALGKGLARLNASTAHCQCTMQHALRVFDGSGQWIWEAPEPSLGVSYVWVHDFDGDSVDEIMVTAQDHGLQHVFVYKRNHSLKAMK